MTVSREQILDKFGNDFVATPDTFHMGIHRLFGEHVGQRFARHHVALDACVGGGLTCVPLAEYVDQVIAVDIDKDHLAMAEQNAKIAGLENVTFILGDVLDLAKSEKFTGVDAVFFDPDWALPGESKENHTGKLDDTSPRVSDFVTEMSRLTRNIAIRLPKETKLSELAALPKHELEENHMDGKLKFYIVYLGDLMGPADFSIFEI